MVLVSVIVLKMPKVQLYDQVRTSILACQKSTSLKVVVHILFAIKGVFLKDLEPMLNFSIN